MLTMGAFSDDDFRRVMVRALWLMLVVTVVVGLLLWWKMGWQTAALLAVGAAVSGSGLWEWLRLMTQVMVKMDGGGKARPMALVLIGFFLRLGLAVAVLYVSLRYLNGSVYALAGGLGMGVFALSYEALKMVKAWTV